HQARDAQHVVGMLMGEEDLSECETGPIAHHLALGAFAAVEQQRLALTGERKRRDVAFHAWARGAGAEQGDGQHGPEGSRKVVNNEK
ncbi:MAG TPA: hypothetical protein VN719_01440, partial [Gemmatimonadales bacterium]|nr:hypothetical protein [Gemmatimonadales bacterium]